MRKSLLVAFATAVLAAVFVPVVVSDVANARNVSTTPGDEELTFRRYRGDDEVTDDDRSGGQGKGRGRGRGRGGGGEDSGDGKDKPQDDGSSSGNGISDKPGGGTARERSDGDDNDRFSR